uniref:NADH dehydrogenase subunit 4L n=1 Tax=Styela plicata TaxID=7726 RepID=D0Z5P4_STYPL|nr:NADH dehydrogenase subunit 4L [Styela plicata]CAL24342.2 NADH dehydrogenase subunit 4L [Styela plicata]
MFVFFIIFIVSFYLFYYKLEIFFILILLEVLFMLVILLVMVFTIKSWFGVVLLTISTCEAVLGITFLLNFNMIFSVSHYL